MGDTCGGSTPLKSFSQYGSQDRSLQQDRVIHGPSAAGPSGFRSNGRAVTEQANANYQAFTAGNALNGPSIPTPSLFAGHGPEAYSDYSVRRGLPLSGAQGPAGMEHARPNIPQTSSRVEVASWAHEFQRLAPNLTATSPAVAPSQAQGTGGQAIPGQYGPNPFVSAPYHQPAPPPILPQQAWGSFNPVVNGHASASETRGMPAPEEDFDDAMNAWMGLYGPKDSETRETVDAAMESVAEQVEASERADVLNSASNTAADATRDMSSTRTLPDVSTLSLGDTTQTNVGPLSAENGTLEAPPSSLASTAVEQGGNQSTSTADTETKNRAQSEIAEAARQLLQAIAHEKGDKWKNSRFLSLMQDFSDGSKDIVDNEIRQVDDFSVDQPSRAEEMTMSPRQEKGKQPDTMS